MKRLAGAMIGLTMMTLVGCAHLPDDNEKSALRRQQQEVKQVETVIYDGKGSSAGLFEQLKTCSMQLHDRVNPSEPFQWSEKIERHPDRDFFAESEEEVSFEQYRLLVEKYKIYKQYVVSKKQNIEQRLTVCQTDLKAAMQTEKARIEREQALLENLRALQQPRPPATVGPASAPAADAVAAAAAKAPATTPAPEERAPAAVPAEKLAEPAATAAEPTAEIEEIAPDVNVVEP